MKALLLSTAISLATIGCAAAGLPQCGDPTVLDTLTKLQIRNVQDKIDGPLAIYMLQTASMRAAAAGIPEKDWMAKIFVGQIHDAEALAALNKAWSNPNLFNSPFIALFREKIGGAKFTYVAMREEGVAGNTKYCAADLHWSMDLVGELKKDYQISYTIQPTEAAELYVQITSGGYGVVGR